MSGFDDELAERVVKVGSGKLKPYSQENNHQIQVEHSID